MYISALASTSSHQKYTNPRNRHINGSGYWIRFDTMISFMGFQLKTNWQLVDSSKSITYYSSPFHISDVGSPMYNTWQTTIWITRGKKQSTSRLAETKADLSVKSDCRRKGAIDSSTRLSERTFNRVCLTLILDLPYIKQKIHRLLLENCIVNF